MSSFLTRDGRWLVISRRIDINSPRVTSLRPQSGFSLLEVIIATAVLAGSAMVLISLIGMGTRFGSKAEQRSLALNAAQTILEEYLINASSDDSDSEVTGVVDGRWPMGYRLTTSSLTADSNKSTSVPLSGLVRLTVELFESEQAMSSGTGLPLCKISRLARRVAELPDAESFELESPASELPEVNEQ